MTQQEGATVGDATGGDEVAKRPDGSKPRRRSRRTGSKATIAAHAAGAVQNGFLTVNARPWGAVYIDGQRVARETPLYRYALPPGSYRVEVVFGEDKKRSEVQVVEVKAGENQTVGFRR